MSDDVAEIAFHLELGHKWICHQTYDKDQMLCLGSVLIGKHHEVVDDIESAISQFGHVTRDTPNRKIFG